MNSNLNTYAFDDYDNYLATGATPLSMLAGTSSVKDIISRYQSMFSNDELKLYDKFTNSQKLFYEGMETFSENYYTGFALKSNTLTNGMTYPLTSPISQNFSRAKDFANYNQLKYDFEKAFKIKVQEKSKQKKLSEYKKSKSLFKCIKNLTVGTVKLSVKIFTLGKKKFVKNPVSNLNGNKLILKTSDKISDADKIAKMYNVVAKHAVSKLYKSNKYNVSNPTAIMSIASLIATQYSLMSCNFGDSQTSKFVFSSLAQQISNQIASLGTLSSTDRNTIKQLSVKSVEALLGKLGKTTLDIKENLDKLGFNLTSSENVEDVLFGTFKSNQNEQTEEVDAEIFDEQMYDISPITERVVEKTASTLKRKTALNNIDNNICKVLAKTIEDYNTKYSSAVTDKKKSTLSNEKDMVSKVLTYYELLSYDFAKSSQKTAVEELQKSKLVTSDDYAKMIALSILKKRNNFLADYFDEKNLKQDKQIEVDSYTSLYKLFITKFGDAKGVTFKTKFQNFLKSKIKNAIANISKSADKTLAQ